MESLIADRFWKLTLHFLEGFRPNVLCGEKWRILSVTRCRTREAYLEEQTLLGVHALRLARRDAEREGVEREHVALERRARLDVNLV